MPANEIWILTVALFSQDTSQLKDTKEFSELADCIKTSQQLIADWQLQGHATSEYLTASCTPKQPDYPK